MHFLCTITCHYYNSWWVKSTGEYVNNLKQVKKPSNYVNFSHVKYTIS